MGLGKLKTRLLISGGLLVGGTCLSTAIAPLGISAAAATLMGTMLAGVTAGIVANDIGSITDSMGQNRDSTSLTASGINHPLTNAVGNAISNVILAAAGTQEFRKHRKVLEKLANVAVNDWTIIAESEAIEPVNRYRELDEKQLQAIFFHPQEFAGVRVLEEDSWEYLLRDWLMELANVNLERGVIVALAEELYHKFPTALRAVITDDFANGGTAFADMVLSMFREIQLQISRQQGDILARLDSIPLGDINSQQILPQIVRRLDSLGQLQVGTSAADAALKQLAHQMTDISRNLQDVKADTQEILAKIAKQPETRVVVEVKSPPPDSNSAYLPPAEPSEDTRLSPPQVIGLEVLPPVPVWEGREELLQQLLTILLAPATSIKVLALIGQGGIGKSSLAFKLLEAVGVQGTTLAADSPFQRVLCFKADEGSSFDEIADSILNPWDLKPHPDTEGKIRQILTCLSQQRCLLLLDNLEAIVHPATHPEAGYAKSPDWGKLLNALVYQHHGSQVAIASRDFPADLADRRDVETRHFAAVPDASLVHRVNLTGVSVAAGMEILRQRQMRDSESDLRWVAERVDGHVFVLTQLASFAKDMPGYLRQHPELVTESAEPILKAQLQRQSQKGQDLLRRMCVLRAEIDIRGLTFLRLYARGLQQEVGVFLAEKLAEILKKQREIPEAEIGKTSEIVKRLVESSLVECSYDEGRRETLYSLHPLVGEFLQARYRKDLPNLLAGAYAFYQSCPLVENPQTLEDLHGVLEAQYFAFQLGNYSEAFNLLRNPIDKYIRPWGHWSLLKELYEQIMPQVQEDIDRVICLQVIGIINRHRGEWDEAERYFWESLTDAKKAGEKSGIAAALGLLGDMKRDRGNCLLAERLYRQSLKLRQELGDRQGMATVLVVLGSIQHNRGNWESAEQLYRKSLDLKEELGDRQGMATSWEQLGYLEYQRGNWESTERFYRQSLELREQLGDRQGMAQVWVMLGNIERKRGNWESAERLYRQSLNLMEELGYRQGIATTWGVLGNIERDRGNGESAERLYRQCLEIYEQLGYLQGIAEVWGALGDIERKRGNWKLAEQLYQQSLDLSKELGHRQGMATSLGCLGNLEIDRDNWESAERFYRQCLEIKKELGDSPVMAILLSFLGLIELSRGNLDSAEQRLTKALTLYQEYGMTWEIAIACHNLMYLERQRGNAEIAEFYYNRARQIYQQLRAAKDLEDIETEWNN